MPTPLNVRLAQYHQGSSYETYTLTPPGGKYGCQPVPERLHYNFPPLRGYPPGPSHLPVTNLLPNPFDLSLRLNHPPILSFGSLSGQEKSQLGVSD